MSPKIQSTDSANHLAVFQEKTIRRTWHNEEWWFSVVDVVGALTNSNDAGAYWRKLKQRLNAESAQPVTFCHGLKLAAPDGKQRITDCATFGLTPAEHGKLKALDTVKTGKRVVSKENQLMLTPSPLHSLEQATVKTRKTKISKK